MNLDEYIKQNYGKETAQQIADRFNVNKYSIYKRARNINALTSKRTNKTFYISEKAKQIILSGILGDGSIRTMGKGAVYREKHGKEEFEYCTWKKINLGELTKDKKMYNYKDQYLSFDTYNTSQLLEYKELTHKEVIERLDKLGIILYLLDDGWTRQYKSYQSFCVESRLIKLEDMILLKGKIEKLFNTKVNINTRVLNSTDKEIVTLVIVDNSEIKKCCEEYNMEHLDVFQKKFDKIKYV